MDAILRLYKNAAALKTLSRQLNDDKHDGLAHILDMLAIDIQFCGEVLDVDVLSTDTPDRAKAKREFAEECEMVNRIFSDDGCKYCAASSDNADDTDGKSKKKYTAVATDDHTCVFVSINEDGEVKADIVKVPNAHVFSANASDDEGAEYDDDADGDDVDGNDDENKTLN